MTFTIPNRQTYYNEIMGMFFALYIPSPIPLPLLMNNSAQLQTHRTQPQSVNEEAFYTTVIFRLSYNANSPDFKMFQREFRPLTE